MEAQAEISGQALRRWVGKTVRVLIDGPDEQDPRLMVARMQSQAPEIDGVVYLDGPGPAALPGRFVQVRITQAAEHDLVGQLVDGTERA